MTQAAPGAVLTARELEVAGLVAGGLTDQQIASRLSISPRTVQAHLRAVYAKTGTGSRTRLVVWLAANPQPEDDRAPFTPGIALWRQVADRIEKRIDAGEFGNGGKLPGSYDLAEHYGVEFRVIVRARAELACRGLVVTGRGRGTFVKAAALQKSPTGAR